MIEIVPARPSHSCDIARLIVEAMTPECCNHLAGPHHSVEDFLAVMQRLVEADHSQYSFRNTSVALSNGQDVAGICVSYNGADLHRLRSAFIAEAAQAFGMDYSHMSDETHPGELYLDSLAVDRAFRRQGIARKLLADTVEKARRLNLPAVGLLVDQGNPDAERLYTSFGFRYINDAVWAGHPMKHLQFAVVP